MKLEIEMSEAEAREIMQLPYSGTMKNTVDGVTCYVNAKEMGIYYDRESLALSEKELTAALILIKIQQETGLA